LFWVHENIMFMNCLSHSGNKLCFVCFKQLILIRKILPINPKTICRVKQTFAESVPYPRGQSTLMQYCKWINLIVFKSLGSRGKNVKEATSTGATYQSCWCEVFFFNCVCDYRGRILKLYHLEILIQDGIAI
jgi:hypothetical protein